VPRLRRNLFGFVVEGAGAFSGFGFRVWGAGARRAPPVERLRFGASGLQPCDCIITSRLP